VVVVAAGALTHAHAINRTTAATGEHFSM
jgi:hypothetical protein